MFLRKSIHRSALFFAAVICTTARLCDACTGVHLKSEDGDYIHARTMEFAANLISFDLISIPRNYEFTGSTPSGQPGLKWKTKYGFVGFNPFGLPVVADGINEKGLAGGAFYFPGYAKFEDVTEKDSAKTISNLDFLNWALSNFSTVEELEKALPDIKVAGVVLKDWGFIPPLHYVITDDTGSTLVLEWVDGKLHQYKNSIGIITNSPTYDWHLTNLRNYIGLSAIDRPTVKIDGEELTAFGQGTGGLGLPGDFSPPSRFVRAAFFANTAYKGKTGPDQVGIAFKILNQFDIPLGAVREMIEGKMTAEATQWTSAADTKNRTYYFHTQFDRNVKKIDLKDVDFTKPKIATINISAPGTYEDISKNFK